MISRSLKPLSVGVGSLALGYDAIRYKKDNQLHTQSMSSISLSPPSGYTVFGFHGTDAQFKYQPDRGNLNITMVPNVAIAYASKHEFPAIFPIYIQTGAVYSSLRGKAYSLGLDGFGYTYHSDLKIDALGRTLPIETITNNCIELTPEAFKSEGHFKIGPVTPISKPQSYIGRVESFFRRWMLV